MSDLFGIIATFQEPQAVTRAAAVLRQSGIDSLEAYTPYPMEELSDILRPRHRSLLPLIMFLAAIGGAALGYWIQYWGEALSYPLNVGGRPPSSWPMFIPITFELTVLTAALAAFLSVFVLCRLPRFHHPLFAAPLFARAAADGFYLCVSADDPRFDPHGTRELLTGLRATGIEEVRA